MTINRMRPGSASLFTMTALALVVAAVLPDPAGAATPAPSLSSIQSKAAAAITLRVNDLNGAVAKANGDAELGPGAVTLVAYLQKDIPGLQALGRRSPLTPPPPRPGTPPRPSSPTSASWPWCCRRPGWPAPANTS